ncbi:XylR N-terminal domain-containing protein [Calidifontibacillus erzurumensis]|uniref:XylR N-terminal domain-containing protein n=1 Tax=Calidifontibacillus erzurumensis TaxID=2741433 RepID=UPI0035B517D0
MLNYAQYKKTDGAIFMDNERILLTPSSVFGTLRKELIDNIGIERVKGFLLRYGWNLGAYDAEKVLASNRFSSISEILRQGPIQHMEKGYTKVNTIRTDIEWDELNQKVKTVYVEGEWLNSYEAEEHLRQFGITHTPICYTLLGYASGYYSTICGHKVIFKEVACKGMGMSYCKYIGKSLHAWFGEADEEVKYYDNPTIVKELERTYEALLQERNNLSKATAISKRITQELVNGRDLQYICDVVYEIINIPMLIEDLQFRDYAYSGLSQQELITIQEDFKEWIQNQKINQGFLDYSTVTKIKANQHVRLLTPIRVQKKIFGYCSFIYKGEEESFADLDYMVLDRLSFIAALHLLNEKTSFEAMERMKGHFLEQVLNGQFTTKKEIFKRGRFINIDLELPFYLMILKYQYPEECLKKELVFHEEMLETTLQYFKQHDMNVIIGQRAGNNVLFVQPNNYNEGILPFCQQFVSYLSGKYIGALFQIGISSLGDDIEKASEYYKEALSALEMSNLQRKVVSFDELGILGMLIHAKDDQALIQRAKSVIGPLINNNGVKGPELVKTLYVFLQNGGNLERTMEELLISKTGLRYRIQKIESVLGVDLRDPDVSYHLRLTLQVLQLKGELKLD